MINPIKLVFKLWLGILAWVDYSVHRVLYMLGQKELTTSDSNADAEGVNNIVSSHQNGIASNVKRIKLLMEFTVGPGPNDVQVVCASQVCQDSQRFFLIRWTISVLGTVILINQWAKDVLTKLAGIESPMLESPPRYNTRSTTTTEDGRVKKSPRRRLSHYQRNHPEPYSVPLKILKLLGITQPEILPTVFELPNDLVQRENSRRNQRKSEVPKRKHSEAESESTTVTETEEEEEGTESSFRFGNDASPNPPLMKNGDLPNRETQSKYRKHVNLALTGNDDPDYISAEDSDYEPTAEELNASSTTNESDISVSHSEIEDLKAGDELPVPTPTVNGALKNTSDDKVAEEEEIPASLPNGNANRKKRPSTLSCIVEEIEDDSEKSPSSVNSSPFSYHSSYYSPIQVCSPLGSPPFNETVSDWETSFLYNNPNETETDAIANYIEARNRLDFRGPNVTM